MLAADKHPSLRGAAERLAQTLRDLFAAYKDVAANPGDRAAMSRLQEVSDVYPLVSFRLNLQLITYRPWLLSSRLLLGLLI